MTEPGLTTPRPLDGGLLWRGEDVFQRPSTREHLTPADLDEITAAVAATAHLPLESIAFKHFRLPKLGPRLARIQDGLETGPGICRLEGFDLDRFESIDALRRAFWGVCRHLGTPVPQTATGECCFDVRNEGLAAGDANSRGPNSNRKLSFHTDRCDVIAFLCIKQAERGGENQVVSSAAVFNEILARRPDLLQVLMRPFYYERHNVDPGNQQAYYQQPIFSFCEGYFATSILRVLIERAYRRPDLPEMTAQQREALDLVETVAGDPDLHVEFRQAPGDILFLNNFTTLHRRTAFEDFPDLSQRRHLLRLWLSMPNSRPLDPAFVASYGATGAGALRGGMRLLERDK